MKDQCVLPGSGRRPVSVRFPGGAALTLAAVCLLAWVLLSLPPRCLAAEGRMRVVFLNPGVSDPKDPTGSFWHRVTDFMSAAAASLDIELETLYAQRDHVLMVEQAREVVARKNPPDYLVVVNEKLAADRMIRTADAAGVKVFLLLNGFYGEQAQAMGPPRVKHRNWIGALLPDNAWAGHGMARALLEEADRHGARARDGRIHMVALAGDLVTPASLQRHVGLLQAVAERPDAVLEQVVVADWREDRAREKCLGLFNRYPEASVLWAANDPMALGAVSAASAAGKKPGQDFFVGGINWDPPALEALGAGSLTVSAGGHFMAGGWALVALYDYHHGIDFADGGAVLKHRVFDLLTPANVGVYLSRFGTGDWGSVDFRKFSKALNPGADGYDFSYNALLRWSRE